MWVYYNNELYHYGVKGMKWGVRRHQNKDGTATSAKNKKQSTPDSEAQAAKERRKKTVKTGALAATSILSGLLGSASVYTLLGNTDLAFSPTARYVASLAAGMATSYGSASLLSLSVSKNKQR